MSITKEDYYRKGHLFLESHDGRNDIFDLFRRDIENGLEKGPLSKAVSAIRDVKSYLKGDNLIFMNHDIPNVTTLKKKKPEIKEDSLLFFKDNLESIIKVFVKTRDTKQKFDILFTLVKFMPEIPDVPMRHYTDLYLLLFHTFLFMDSLDGKDNDREDFGRLLIKVLARYDCAETGRSFIRDSMLIDVLEDESSRVAPYEKYVERLKGAARKVEMSNSFNEEDLTPLFFTDNILFLIDNSQKGVVESLMNNLSRIESFVLSRSYSLFNENSKEIDILNNALRGVIGEKMSKMKSGPATPNLSRPLSIHQQTELL